MKRLIQVADISRSTYYYRVKQMNKPDPDKELKETIEAIFDKHKGRYGYRRIHLELKKQGYEINHKKVQRIMRDIALKSFVRKQKYNSYKGRVGKVADNILNRDFKAEKPNEKWVTDITEFKLPGGKGYFSPVMDLYNGEIITYTIKDSPSYSLVENMMNQAFQYVNEDDNLTLHSDQGWHYQMAQYRQKLKDQNITQSMSRKGNCHDNAVIENFFGIFKTEFYYDNEFESFQQFTEELEEYIWYYNHERIKTNLRMSPVSYRNQTQAA